MKSNSTLALLEKKAKERKCKIIFSKDHYRIKYMNVYSEKCDTFWDGYKNIVLLTTI